MPRLFAPLGLDDVSWVRCPNGRVLAGEGIALRTEELARLGVLIRDRGCWRGEQLVPAEIIDAMHSGWLSADDSVVTIMASDHFGADAVAEFVAGALVAASRHAVP